MQLFRPDALCKPAPQAVTITSVEYHEYKTFARYSLTLREMNILVGSNNCGKSTLLGPFRALEVALRTARTRNPTYLYGPRGYTFGYCLPDENFPLSLENVHNEYKPIPSTVTFRLSNGNRLSLHFPDDGGWMLVPETVDRPVRSTSHFRESFPITIVAVPVLGPLEHREQLLQYETVQRNVNTHLAPRHFRNYWWHNPDGFADFAKLVAVTWPGMEVESPERVESTSAELAMFCREDRITREIYWAGFGFQVWCQLLTHLSRARGATILIVDEPEIYLHPDVQRQLLGLFRDISTNVLLATHSSEIIAEADPSEILMVDKMKYSAKRLHNITGVQAVLASIGSLHNVTLTRIAKNPRLVFTEGAVDWVILRHFARKLRLVGLAAGNDITPITSDGYSSVAHMKSLKWGFEKTLDQSPAIAVVFDRDYRSKEEVASVLGELATQVDLAHVHDRKELENYLLVPTALQRAIEQELRKKSDYPVEAVNVKTEIVQLLARFSEPMKSELLGQYLARRLEFLRGDKRDPATINQETIDWFDQMWSAIETRMELVPGKQILAMLRTALHETYGISLTPQKIIDGFHDGELPADLVSLLSGLDELRRKNR